MPKVTKKNWAPRGTLTSICNLVQKTKKKIAQRLEKEFCTASFQTLILIQTAKPRTQKTVANKGLENKNSPKRDNKPLCLRVHAINEITKRRIQLWK